MHAGIEFQPALQRPGQAGLLQPGQLLGIGDTQPQVQFGDQGQFRGLEHPLQQEDGSPDPGFAQRHRLFHAGHRQRVGQGRQLLCHHQGAVAVAVGLDHRHDPGVGCQCPGHAEIVAQRGEIQPGLGGARHQKSNLWVEYRRWAASQTSPTSPLPTGLPSMDSTGAISLLELVSHTSSALPSSASVTTRS